MEGALMFAHLKALLPSQPYGTHVQGPRKNPSAQGLWICFASAGAEMKVSNANEFLILGWPFSRAFRVHPQGLFRNLEIWGEDFNRVNLLY